MENLDEIVFKNRNKSYGAYVIRKNYIKNIKKSFSVTLLLILSILWFQNSFSLVKEDKVILNDRVIEIEDIKVIKDIPEEIVIPKNIDIKTVAYVVPEVVEDDDEDLSKLIEIDSLLNSNIGLTDNEGTDTIIDIIDIDFGTDSVQIDEIIEPKIIEPSIDEIFNGKEPQAANLDIIKKKIQYNKNLIDMGIKGKVIIRCLIDIDGKIIKYVVIRTPHELFIKDIVKHFDELVFTPAIQNNKPVKCWINIPFDFKLK